MTPPAVLKRRSEGTKRTEHYPAEISGTWYHFGRNRSRNRIRKNGRISGQPEPDIRYILTWKPAQQRFIMQSGLLTNITLQLEAAHFVNKELWTCSLPLYYLHPTYIPASHTMSFIPQCSLATTHYFSQWVISATNCYSFTNNNNIDNKNNKFTQLKAKCSQACYIVIK